MAQSLIESTCEDKCIDPINTGVKHHQQTSQTNNNEKTPIILKDTTPRVASRCRKLVVLICCVLLHTIVNGIGYGLSIMYAELIIVFNAPRAQASLIQGLYMGFSTGAGILFVGVIKKFGPGCCIIVGTLFACVGFFASGFCVDINGIILLTGCLAAIGMCLCYLSAFLTVGWIFYSNPGVYLTSLTIGSSLGQFLVPVFYEIFIEKYTWAGAFILLSGISLQCLPIGLMIYYSRDFFYISDVREIENSKKSLCDVSICKDGVIWILLLNIHLLALTGNVEPWFIVDFMISRGFSRDLGSTLVSVIGIANFIGRLAGTAIRFKCTKFLTIYHWVYLCPIAAVAHALVINVYDYSSIMTLCLLYGISFGTINAQTPTIMYEAIGLERYPTGIAMVNVMSGFGNILSNLLGGN
ncbi:hypothetical protein ACF0H5_022591 [Mactra antiquata]